MAQADLLLPNKAFEDLRQDRILAIHHFRNLEEQLSNPLRISILEFALAHLLQISFIGEAPAQVAHARLPHLLEREESWTAELQLLLHRIHIYVFEDDRVHGAVLAVVEVADDADGLHQVEDQLLFRKRINRVVVHPALKDHIEE
eukprot:CAMPEP_0202959516 /NCGR_PEP_ID=MMETSP1396-20130829/3695_1 /ASSEMBLY_ACC=CAM_ASM_000872 /TAXON_ID= /ORGANISM="Pseudokeronopsis sp., Strain Brazil" /LENGTH=144 /DNA_ID=CAMNT_0049678105 /DNA_START=1731 /DNA_END=2165 /DNA_ORIENTATION=+